MEDMFRAMSEIFTAQLSAINSQMIVVNERVDNVEKRPRPTDSTAPSRPVPIMTIQAPTSSVSKEAVNTLWCNRPIDEPIPINVVTWFDEDPADREDGCQLQNISDETEAFLENAFANQCRTAQDADSKKSMVCQTAT